MIKKIKNIIDSYRVHILWVCLLTVSLSVLYKYHSVYDPIIMSVIGTLVKVYIIYMAWVLSKEFSSSSTSLEPIVYAKAIGICAFIAIMIWANYGTHTEGGDPLYGGGETVVDFLPTDKEKNEHGWTIFFTLLAPVLYGVSKGIEKKRLKDIG